MLAYCKTVDEGRPNSLSFSYTHMFETLCKYIPCTTNIIHPITHYLICDLDISVDSIIGKLADHRKDGMKVILMVFDPPAFPRVDNLISNNALDKIILFDNQFKNRFKIPTYVSDYFFNEDVFPKRKVDFENKVCVFGHLLYGRNNDFNLPQVDTLPHIKSYWDLYDEVRKYNGVAVYDTGLSENRSSIVTYNKAKAIETLMCGRNAYCKDGIKTKRYDRFLKKYSDIPNPKEVDFSQEEIFEINDLTIQELVYELKYI